MKLEWKDIYSVKNESLDEDHRKMFDYINKIEENLYNRSSNFFQEIIGDLKKYSKTHFEKEELYMRSIHFNKIEEHILEHKEFSQKILELSERSKDFILLNNMLDFIKEWIIAHILGSDQEYVQKTECPE